jgi:O-antigen ligase
VNLFSRLLLLVGGILLSLGGLVGIGLGLIAIIDPVGTKMADDSDPFGSPPSVLGSVLITIVFALVVVGGFAMIRFSDHTAKRR